MGISLIDRIETFHNKNLLHRDIKPENFVIGVNEENNLIHLIDFGLARLYKNMQGLHVSMREGYGLIGTARYASINAHIGRELSRRDDLESIGYTLIYFLKGKLPWQDVKGTDRKAKYKKIKEVKLSLPIEKLCEGLPSCFAVYMNYVRNLNFAEAPSYKHLRKVFEEAIKEKGQELDYEFDWVIKNRIERGLKSEGPSKKKKTQEFANEMGIDAEGQKESPSFNKDNMGRKAPHKITRFADEPFSGRYELGERLNIFTQQIVCIQGEKTSEVKT